ARDPAGEAWSAPPRRTVRPRLRSRPGDAVGQHRRPCREDVLLRQGAARVRATRSRADAWATHPRASDLRLPGGEELGERAGRAAEHTLLHRPLHGDAVDLAPAVVLFDRGQVLQIALHARCELLALRA